MSEIRLNQEEADWLESYESGEWQSVESVQAEVERYRQYATATIKKDRRVNIRISSKDLLQIQARAVEEGIPYQTLISSVLHKYVSGRLIEQSRS